MIRSITLVAMLSVATAFAQGPAVTSWIINPGTETGYGGYLSNVQSVYYTATDAYVACTCIPGYDIGPWAGNPNTPANQNFVFKITRNPVQNTGTLTAAGLGHIGVWRNGVSVFNAEDAMSYNNQGIWNRDALVFEGASFDVCLGHPAPNGEYHHHVSPNCLYNYMDDEVHSDLIGYAFDGFPIYGTFAFANTDGTGGITRMRTGYQLRAITDRTTLADGTVLTVGQYGPAIGTQYPLGSYIEDYEFVAGLGDLDEHNGRFCVTPEYPDGIYAYFVTLNDAGAPVYPYTIGPTYYGTVQAGNSGPASGHNTVPGGAVLYDPSVTGIEAIARDAFTVFPVPADSELNIRTDGAALRAVEVIDGAGRVVLQVGATGIFATVSIEGLAAGVYTARITSADGSVVLRPFVRR